MPCYVDQPIWPHGRMMMCHMFADSLAELHAMADEIGVPRRHFQWKGPGKPPHYDICKSKRAMAVKAGAIEMRTWGEVRETMRRSLAAALSEIDVRACGGDLPDAVAAMAVAAYADSVAGRVRP